VDTFNNRCKYNCIFKEHIKEVTRSCVINFKEINLWDHIQEEETINKPSNFKQYLHSIRGKKNMNTLFCVCLIRVIIDGNYKILPSRRVFLNFISSLKFRNFIPFFLQDKINYYIFLKDDRPRGGFRVWASLDLGTPLTQKNSSAP
jgi:hypothetical protein